MSNFFPDFLKTTVGGRWQNDVLPLTPITGFSNDTRTLRPNDCFVALRTEKRDGHDFLDAAQKAGAAAALVETIVPASKLPQLLVHNTEEALQRLARAWRDECAVPVFGITGSVGKTSTKDLLRAVLGQNAFATEANLNNLLGVPLMLLRVDPEKHRQGAVIEAGMSVPGELDRLAWMIKPDCAIVTNVNPAHLAGLGSMEAIAHEKAALCRQTSALGISIFPAECLKYAAFRRLLGRNFPMLFPGDSRELLTGVRYEVSFETQFAPLPNGHAITISGHGKTFGEFRFPPATTGMLRNAALTAAAAMLAGVSANRIQEAFAGYSPSARRGECREHEGRLFYIDCYNASPASMTDSAEAFDARTKDAPARLFVLGGMNELGTESVRLHEQVGTALPLRAGDKVILFGGDSLAIGTGAIAGGFSRNAVQAMPNIDAVREAVKHFRGPVFLKGSRSYALERALPDELQKTKIL